MRFDLPVTETEIGHNIWLFLTDVSFWPPNKSRCSASISALGYRLILYGMERVGGTKICKEDIFISDRGKPYIRTEKNKRGLFFNVSHSGRYVACVVAGSEIGCDIQKIRRVPENLFPYIGKMMAVTPEFQHVSPARLTSAEQTLLWTRYESLGKYLGTGIPIPESALSNISADRETSPGYGSAKKREYMSFTNLEGYVLSVCF